jgi:hypothetical protein
MKKGRKVGGLAILILSLAPFPAYSYKIEKLEWGNSLNIESPYLLTCNDGTQFGVGLDNHMRAISPESVANISKVICSTHGGIAKRPQKSSELDPSWREGLSTVLMVPGYAYHAWYLSAYRVEDFNALAAQALSGFTPDVIRNANGTVIIPVFAATQVESSIQAGVGAVLRLRDWLALDLGLSFGSGTASRSSINTLAVEKADFRLFGGHITAKVYPLQMERVQPWLSAGVRGLALHPTGGTYTSRERGLDLPGRSFEPASTADFVAGAGVDVRLTDRLGLTLSGDHGLSTGWRAGVAVNLLYPWLEP